MDRDFVASLVELNNDFYRKVADSFSATRQAPWPGWQRVFDAASAGEGGRADEPYRVLDLACGNMRFERFFQDAWSACGAAAPLEFYPVDACRDLAGDDSSFIQLDILGALMGDSVPVPLAPPCDLAVCFGFMHHVPSRGLRLAVLDLLANAVKPGGLISISFWAFMNDPKLAAKAAQAEALAQVAWPFHAYDLALLEPGDHLLGWQQDPGAYRYCHHFDDVQIDDLLAAHNAASPVYLQELDRYDSDGRSHNLNRYVLLRRVK